MIEIARCQWPRGLLNSHCPGFVGFVYYNCLSASQPIALALVAYTSCIACQNTFLFLLLPQFSHMGYFLLMQSLGSSHVIFGILDPLLRIVSQKAGLLLVPSQHSTLTLGSTVHVT